jgi:peptidoglycan/xylan/chitin deacetylase (PgdA/CDA1 family)
MKPIKWLALVAISSVLISFTSCRRNEKITLIPHSSDVITQVQYPSEYYEHITIPAYQRNSNKIPVLMYHSLEKGKNWISSSTFRYHLQLLYEAGYSSLKLEDYMNNNFDSIPNGRKPVIITFDDQWASQFSFDDPTTNKINPNCAVGILEDFATKHPDFGKNAVFFLFFHRLPFIGHDDTDLWKTKITYLIKHGYEIGSHTWDHSIMTKMTPVKIKTELDKFYQILDPIIGEKVVHTMTLAYPGGAPPILDQSIRSYRYQNYPLKAAFLAFGGFASVPFLENPDLIRIPRIEGSTLQIKRIIQQNSFVVDRHSIKIPKIFSYSRDSVLQYVETISPQYKKNLFLGNFSDLK